MNNKIHISLLTSAFFLFASCQTTDLKSAPSQTSATQTPPTKMAVATPEPILQVLLTTSETEDLPFPSIPILHDTLATFILPAGSNLGANLHSALLTEPLEMERVGSWFVVTLEGEWQGFDYYFILLTSEDKKIRSLDTNHHRVSWVKGFASTIPRPENPILEVYPELRTVVILPPGYDGQNQSYPVMYWHDGNNMPRGRHSPGNGWGADVALSKVLRENRGEPIIQVGIFNSSKRMEEYAGWVGLFGGWDFDNNEYGPEVIPLAQNHDEYVRVTVRAWVDDHYRTLKGPENTGIGGSSAGAMMAMYQGLSHPEVYGKIAALAGGEVPYFRLISSGLKPTVDQVIWLDCGTVGIDQQLLPGSEAMAKWLEPQMGKRLYWKIYQGAQHNEQAWSQRLPDVLSFLFPKRIEKD